MDDKKDNEQKKVYRGSLIFPILLIALGIVLLLNTLDLLPGSFWDSVWRLWPLLLIAIGLDGILRKRGLVGGSLLVSLGIIFLLNNYDLLDINVWSMLLSLWPIFLIAIGIDILVSKSRSVWANLLGLILVLVILFGSMWVLGILVVDESAVSGDQIIQPLNGATSAEVIIQPGAGDLTVGAQGEEETLIEGTVPESTSGLTISQNYSVSDEVGRYTIKASGMTVYPSSKSGQWDWDLNINKDIPIELGVSQGVGMAVLELRELAVSDLETTVSIGKLDLYAPESVNMNATVEVAIGQIVIYIPAGVGAKIFTDTGLTIVQVPDGYIEGNEVYTSPNYSSSENRIDIWVELAIGNLVIRQE